MPILKTRANNDRGEIEFELNFLSALTTRQRFEMMFRKSREVASLLKRNGRRTASQVVKRSS